MISDRDELQEEVNSLVYKM